MTNWALPTTVVQYAESGAEDIHVSWLDIDNFNNIKTLNGKYIKTSRDLVHIARDPKHDIVEKTYYLRLTGFSFESLPATISGIQFKINMNRFGRISDDTIQLCLNGNGIGDNLADTGLSPIKTYGDSSSLWNSNLTISDIQNPDFGILLRFKSHPNWPHKSSCLIDSAELRIY